MPAQLIEKSMASPSLVAGIAIAKFCDHLPLYRQEQIFERIGITLSRQTMSAWILTVGEKIIPLVNLLQDHILDYDVAFADETTVQVLNEPGRPAKTKSYIWNFSGGPADKTAVIYQYHPTRSGDTAKDFFQDYPGAVHCDGYTGYNQLAIRPSDDYPDNDPLATKPITIINCFAHVRRKFIESAGDQQPTGIAAQALDIIGSLYHIESQLSEQRASLDLIKTTRQTQSLPILNPLEQFLTESAKKVPPKSSLGKAITYTVTRWDKLTQFIQDGRYQIDNNRSERFIKPFVMGRKNWLFCQSIHGAHASARLYSLIESAKANQLNPFKYLIQVFTRLPLCTTLEDFEQLLPFNILIHDG
jgi:transposase